MSFSRVALLFIVEVCVESEVQCDVLQAHRESHGRPPGCLARRKSACAVTVPPFTGSSSDVATACSVTPAHATSACKSMSPEHASMPVPPVEGWSPASTSRLPVSTEHATPSLSEPLAVKTTRACSRVLAVGVFERTLDLPKLVWSHDSMVRPDHASRIHLRGRAILVEMTELTPA